MKLTVDIDCTPAEAREFLGLPDVRPMQEELMREMQDRMQTAIKGIGPEEAMKMWLPAGLQGWDQMQRFFAQMAAAGNKE